MFFKSGVRLCLRGIVDILVAVDHGGDGASCNIQAHIVRNFDGGRFVIDLENGEKGISSSETGRVFVAILATLLSKLCNMAAD